MKISAKIDYACRALLELSVHWPKPEPLRINTIAEHQKIPLKFLTLILLQLKQLGYVQSTRGQNGGYLLGKTPREITLKEVIQKFSEKAFSPSRADHRKHSGVLDAVWQEAEKMYLNFLEGKNFEDMAYSQRSLVKVPMYTI